VPKDFRRPMKVDSLVGSGELGVSEGGSSPFVVGAPEK